MAKRKRESESSVEDLFKKFRGELLDALKATRGFERQRLSKRIHDPSSTAEKIQRLEREVLVLKSLDLSSTAGAHLSSVLLRLKPVAESPDLPAPIRAGAPKKPELSEEERAALHNITSALCGRKEVRDVVDKAVVAICAALGVRVPQRKGRAGRNGELGENGQEGGPGDREGRGRAGSAEKGVSQRDQSGQGEKKAKTSDSVVDDGRDSAEAMASDDEEGEEGVLSRFHVRLAASSDDGDEGGGVDLPAGKDPLQLSPSEGVNEEVDQQGGEDVSMGSSEASDEEQHTSKPQAKGKKSTVRQRRPERASGSTFLPTLTGGYISGSESEASDIDVAPAVRKNRRGQKARQAIWEKKYRDNAKHLQRNAGGTNRDAGWDLRHGAVDGEKSGKPWKSGIQNPMERRRHNVDPASGQTSQPPEVSRKRPAKDDEGQLHPSWEARKKAKEKETTAVFQGKKTVF